MTFTAGELLAIIAGMATIVTAISVGIVNIIVALRTDRSVKENTLITAATLTKTAVIEGHVNSRETKLSEQVLAAERENKLLRDLIADKSATAALLAQAAASQLRTRPIDGDAPITPLAAPHVEVTTTLKGIEENTEETAKNTARTLKEIEVNTDETAKNTARTDATIAALKDEKR